MYTVPGDAFSAVCIRLYDTSKRRGFIMRELFYGILIGFACILPGASGGVLAVALGLYRPMLHAALHLPEAPARHIRALWKPAAGIAAGIILGALCLRGAMAKHERLMLFLFTGLIAGGMPQLVRTARQHDLRPKHLPALGAGILLALPLAAQPSHTVQRLSPLQALVTGGIEGVGTVVPGLSASMLLIRLGWYQAYLSAVYDVPRLLLMGVGFVLACLVCMRAVEKLFERAPCAAYLGVLGFSAVSVALVFPGFTRGILFWAETAALAAGAVTVSLSGRFQKYRGVME